jgi:transposase
MAPYSSDLRERVARAWDAGMKPDQIAVTYEVSRSWVYRLLQRRRVTGSLAPLAQTKFRSRTLTGDEEERLMTLLAVRPDATLAELQQALPTTAALSTIWRAIGRRGFTVKKNRTRRRTAPA